MSAEEMSATIYREEISVKAIYRFKQSVGQMGDLAGVFIAGSDDVEKIMGETVYFGEVLGKHSDIEIEIDSENLTIISDDPDAVLMFENLKLETGHNPFDYWDGDND